MSKTAQPKDNAHTRTDVATEQIEHGNEVFGFGAVTMATKPPLPQKPDNLGARVTGNAAARSSPVTVTRPNNTQVLPSAWKPFSPASEHYPARAAASRASPVPALDIKKKGSVEFDNTLRARALARAKAAKAARAGQTALSAVAAFGGGAKRDSTPASATTPASPTTPVSAITPVSTTPASAKVPAALSGARASAEEQLHALSSSSSGEAPDPCVSCRSSVRLRAG